MEEESVMRMGSSLKVANVQALASASGGSAIIPQRYVRAEAELDPVAGEVDAGELPVVDLGRLLDPRFSCEESAKLELACQEWGFFQLINHGIPEELIDKMKADTMEFFKIPLKEKEEHAQLPNSLEGYGQAFVVSEDQKLDWMDMLYIITRPTENRNMRFWPTQPPTFRDTLDKYSLEVKNLASILLGLMAKNLGLDPKLIANIFEDQPQGIRINYYPPCPKAGEVLGISPHTDGTGLTLLLQVSEVQGLQIKKNDKWFPIQPLPYAFIVNIGDILEILTNGRYRSIEHRAIINNEKERLSIAAFHGPKNDTTVGPLPDLATEGEKYRSMSYENYMKTYFSAKLDGRGLLERMKL